MPDIGLRWKRKEYKKSIIVHLVEWRVQSAMAVPYCVIKTHCISIPDMIKSNKHRVLSGIPNIMGESYIAIPNVFKSEYLQ